MWHSNALAHLRKRLPVGRVWRLERLLGRSLHARRDAPMRKWGFVWRGALYFELHLGCMRACLPWGLPSHPARHERPGRKQLPVLHAQRWRKRMAVLLVHLQMVDVLRPA